MTGIRTTTRSPGLVRWRGTGWRRFHHQHSVHLAGMLFLLPFIIVLAMSLAMRASASPQFLSDAAWPSLRFDDFARLFDDSIFVRVIPDFDH